LSASAGTTSSISHRLRSYLCSELGKGSLGVRPATQRTDKVCRTSLSLEQHFRKRPVLLSCTLYLLSRIDTSKHSPYAIFTTYRALAIMRLTLLATAMALFAVTAIALPTRMITSPPYYYIDTNHSSARKLQASSFSLQRGHGRDDRHGLL
jgi:hypothetical protein